ncbi:MAG: Hsp20/alpha crystallin family protein [Synechococcus sp. SB0662_bin_45]|nr:Hsp20/alpha crystallin family protein [Cyanobacteria bacterium MAG IRC3_bin_20]MCY3653753.1 Hsp20/alpha crystallin family protein [Cyanobacteria bacterium MAG IRC1_bin_28]MXW12001.1 Hsp20/alpha crystallin family protein [Synechococcus sp. SB0668_bin_13]MXX09679.1 Hsp20/alpha crystallin family protein [Synechococcus sp. SB0667_bin_8]MXY61847.1 Hsp20/alpha crystallin family protein [Synechococcus sp. SB0665_bin_28]MYE21672.1 Hsp20/alpha crystallin family protein [Synechococcus sp. SB0662_bin_
MLALSQSPFSLFEHLDRQFHQAEGTPVAEIRENDNRYQVAVELPGISKDAIDVKATEHGMTISAERPNVDVGEDRVLSEFRYGNWRRSFYFGKRIDPNQLQAALQDGILHITAPKVDSVKAVSIKVGN